MTHRPRNSSSRDGAVGYGKPPSRTRFRKGVSGNPGGRPRGMTAGRATALAIKEAYRLVTVREGDQVLTMPAVQAVLRSQVALAAKGNGPAQRALIEVIQTIEREIAMPHHEGDLLGGVAERLAAALARAGQGTNDQVRSDRHAAARIPRRRGPQGHAEPGMAQGEERLGRVERSRPGQRARRAAQSRLHGGTRAARSNAKDDDPCPRGSEHQ